MKSNQDTSQFEPIDAQRALELLEKAVAERGEEYVYEPIRQMSGGSRCVYVHDGQPSCMVGVALSLHGIPLGALEATGNVGASGLSDDLPCVSGDAARIFDAAQSAQDGGRSWRDALRSARHVAETLRPIVGAS